MPGISRVWGLGLIGEVFGLGFLEVSRLGMLQGFRAKGRPYRGGLGLRAWGLGDSRPEIEAGV